MSLGFATHSVVPSGENFGSPLPVVLTIAQPTGSAWSSFGPQTGKAKTVYWPR